MADSPEPTPAADGRGRVIACFLCATFEPYPQRWKQGRIQLDADGVRWARGLLSREGASLMPSPLRLKTVRDARGWEKLHIKASAFQIVEITADLGEIRLAVPRERVPLVVEHLQTNEPPA